MKICIKSDQLITAGGPVNGYLCIHDGIITSIHATPPATPGDYHLVDATGLVVMPGIFDTHVHLNEPGRSDWEGFDTGTHAAVAGGVTSLADMPLNSSPVTTTPQHLLAKQQAAAGKLHCHVGFWGGVVPGNAHHLQGLATGGVLGFKAFLSPSGIDEFPNVTEADLHTAMPIIAGLGLPLLVHAELTDDIDRVKGDARHYATYLATRPPQWENDAIALLVKLCGQYQCRVHVVHLSSAPAIEQVMAAKNKGLPITAETGQHYLFFNAEDIPDGGTAYKCAPPIRDGFNNQQLWQALQQGTIDFVATDHSPAPPALKEIESGNFLTAWGGIASIQFALPALWTAARQRNIPAWYMARWLCSNPAKLAGLDAVKGLLAPGYHADITIWNPEEHFVVTEQEVLHRHKVTPYLGRRLYGKVHTTIINGQVVYSNGQLLQPATGKILHHG